MSIFIKILFLSFLFITSLVSNDKVTLQLKWFHQFQFAGYYAAKEKGFYDEVGLDVEIKERNPKLNNIEQVINGEATYGIADSILLLYKAKDKPVVIVSPIFQHSGGIVYSLKDNQLNSPYKFDGKDMLFYKNDTDGFAILGMLKHLNIIPNLIRNRQKDDHLKLLTGEIDLATGYMSNELYYFKKNNIDLNIINPANYGFDLYGDMIFTTQDEAHNNPTRVKKFKEASIKGWEYALNNKEEIIQLIKKKYNQKKSIEHLRYEAKIIQKLITKDLIEMGTIDEGRISYIFDLYKRFGLTNNNLDLNKFIFKEYSSKPGSSIQLTQKEIDFIKNTPSIKVSNELDWAPFDFAIDGIPKGYSIDLLNLLTKKLDLEVEYINGYTWSELIELFKNKKLDLLHSLAKDDKREKFGIFSKPYTRYQTHFITRLNQENITGIEQVRDKTFVVGKNWAIDNYLTKNFPQLKVIRVSTLDEILDYVSSGKADIAILNKNVANYHIKKRYISNLKISSWVKDFDKNKAQMLHFLAQKDKPLLNSILNKALESLSLEEVENLNKKWFGQVNNNQNINNKESEFISNNAPIRFKVSPNRPPFEFEENGKPVGLALDYVRKSAKNIGLEVEFVLNDDPVSISHKHINNTRDKYDSHLFTVKNPKREKEFSFGVDYLTYPSMIISSVKNTYINSMNDLNGKEIVLEEKYLTNKWIKRDYPNIKIINVKNTIEALKLVDAGKVDAYIGNSAIAHFLKTHKNYTNLKVVAPSGYGNIKYSFVGPKQWPELTSLLSKGYKMIKPIEHTEIQQKWFTGQTVQKEIDYTILWQVFGTFTIVLIWITWWNRKLSKEKDKTQKALLELKKSKEYQIKQQEVILNQSKIADMGEMLANVAHQWRQPLSIISTVATGTKLKKELNNLTEDELLKNMDSINNNAQHLSKTIDTFRNFLKENKDFKEVILQDRITLALDIYGTILKNNQINIINEINKHTSIKINLVIGELSQVLGNILNNAKDVLIERNIKDRWVKIDLKTDDDTVTVTIEDNAGGIEDSIINKVFDPYFTTKHSSQGTGLGLHMSYRIVKESLDGNLYVTNTNDGAKFHIEIPLKKD